MSSAPPRVRVSGNVDVIAWSVAGVVFIVHALVAGRYDAFRNELYFIVCGRHPAFGYVDQPPLVPLLAALTQAAGDDVWLLRLPAVLAATLLVPLTVAFARTLGAGRVGAWIAAIAAATSSLAIAITSTFTTETFEPLLWTLTAYLIARALVRDERRLLIWAGVVAGIALETKYGILVWLIGLAIGIGATSARRLVSREFWIGAGCAVAIALPNFIWQAANQFPFLEVVRNDNAGNLTGSPLEFALDQVLGANIVLAPLWLAGVIAPFARAPLAQSRLARFRFLSIAFGVSVPLVFATHGKSYYLVGAYPTMFALGAAACSALAGPLAAAWMALAVANAALALPLLLPVLSPDGLARFLARAPFRPHPVEVAGIGAPLTQVFSDEFGWRELEHKVAAVYRGLPASDRARAAILATDYGEAAAIDVYGVPDHLPPAISEQDQYYLWGPRGYDGSVVIAVNAKPEFWSRICASSTTAATFGVPYAMPYERDRAIVVCRGLPVPLADAWARFKRYGL